MTGALRPQVACIGELEWCARVLDADDNVVYIEAGFSKRESAEDVARTMAKGLPLTPWIDVD